MRHGYWIGGVLILLGVGLAIAVIVSRVIGISDTIDTFPKTRLSEGVVQLEAREYHVYMDAPSSAGDFGWTLAVFDDQRAEVKLRTPGSDFEWSAGGRQGYLVAKITVPRAGRYTVRGTGPQGARVIFGKGLFGTLISGILLAIVTFFVLGGVGLGLIIRTAIKRRPREQKTWP